MAAEYGERDRVPVIATNPPFGGMEQDGIENNFPATFRTRETADLFLVLLMSLLLEHGQLASLVTADQRGWLALAYTIFIGGIVGFGLWFWLIARCSMNRVAPFGLLLPVFALISSVLFLGDRMTPKLIAGGLLAISGVAITQVRSPDRPI